MTRGTVSVYSFSQISGRLCRLIHDRVYCEKNKTSLRISVLLQVLLSAFQKMLVDDDSWPTELDNRKNYGVQKLHWVGFGC